jgi:hypothetical protein
LRWKDIEAGLAEKPGARLWRVELQCEVAHLAAFKKSLWQVDGLDPALSPEVESSGGAARRVTVAVRERDQRTAGERAAEIVSTASLAVLDGSAAVVLNVEPIEE